MWTEKTCKYKPTEHNKQKQQQADKIHNPELTKTK